MMKRILLTFGIACLSVFSIQAQENKTDNVVIVNPNAAVMNFETDVIDYGTIEQGAEGVREFKFKNTGKEPLIISNATGSCGCTVPTWSKEPILPGKSGVISVKYDTKRLGAINKTVTVTSNASEPTKVLRIKGDIIAPKTSPVKEGSAGPVEH